MRHAAPLTLLFTLPGHCGAELHREFYDHPQLPLGGTSGRSLVGCPCSYGPMQEVVLGALVRADRVLLVHRSPNKHAYPNVWDLPGGLIEPGESELEALTRELHEELGVQIATGSASHLCRLTAGPADEPALVSAWLVRDWQGTPLNVAPEEHDDIGWFQLEELPPPSHVLVHAALLEAMRSHPD